MDLIQMVLRLEPAQLCRFIRMLFSDIIHFYYRQVYSCFAFVFENTIGIVREFT